MLTMGLKTWVARLNNGAYSQTVSEQAQIKTALIGFLRTYGRLPCPSAIAGLVPTGSEVPQPPLGLGCTANAQAAYGVVPWVTLNISRDTVLDGWGNFITYRVANGVAPVAKNWTSKTLTNPFDVNELATPSAALTINQGYGIVAPTLVTANAVVVIYSHGKNGFGATTVQGTPSTPPPALNTDENINALNTTTTFIMRPYTENAAAFNGLFDDAVTYMLPQDLLQPLVSEGTVSACRSYCPSASCTGSGVPYLFCTGANTPSSPPSSCTGLRTPYLFCTGLGIPNIQSTGCTASATPSASCTGPGTPAISPVSCTGVATPYTFCTGVGTPAFIAPAACTGLSIPFPFCTGATTPFSIPNPCTGSGIPFAFCTGSGIGVPSFPPVACTGVTAPYAFCTGAGTPTFTSLCTVSASTPVRLGNPTPTCPQG